MPSAAKIGADDLAALGALEKKVLWLASWTIHHANYVRKTSMG
jgi:pyruvate dehydrogenase E1 component